MSFNMAMNSFSNADADSSFIAVLPVLRLGAFATVFLVAAGLRCAVFFVPADFFVAVVPLGKNS